MAVAGALWLRSVADSVTVGTTGADLVAVGGRSVRMGAGGVTSVARRAVRVAANAAAVAVLMLVSSGGGGGLSVSVSVSVSISVAAVA